MFSIQKSFLTLAAIAATLSSSNAFAIPFVDLGVMAGGAISAPTISDPAQLAGSTLSGGFGLSGGASLGLGPIEVSALYSQLKAKIAGGPVNSEVTSNYLDIPVLLRMGLGPISFGVGGFYSVFLSGSSSVPGDTVDGKGNYGPTASLRFTVPVVGFFVDGRYSLGLKETNGVKMSTAGVYLGFNFL
jgi:hypothetical protein